MVSPNYQKLEGDIKSITMDICTLLYTVSHVHHFSQSVLLG